MDSTPVKSDEPQHAHLLVVLGHAGVGKDTVAAYLSRRYGFKVISLYQPLKRICVAMGLGLNRDTVSKMGRILSTNLGRDVFINWCDGVLTFQDTVIKDIRYLNEVEHYRSTSCLSLFIQCEPKIALARIIARKRPGDPITMRQLEEVWSSERELDLIPEHWTVKIDNSGSRKKLYNRLDGLIRELK
ncbi:MAG: hypothetical protein M1357_02810 [Candidatus Marsarchaeota archaeon]|nr:hypothetical protein [Candidatus Marsarchaeota archaeon]